MRLERTRVQCACGLPVATGVTQIESGKRNDRPELEKAIATCKKQRAKRYQIVRTFLYVIADCRSPR